MAQVSVSGEVIARERSRRNKVKRDVMNTLIMEEFFRTVEEVRGLISKISSQADQVKTIHGVILSSPTQDRKSKEELDLLNGETKKNAHLVRAKLKFMLQKWPLDDSSSGSTVVQRIQKNQHAHLTWWFSEVMRSFHKAQVCFREKCKAQIQRQLEIVDKVTTDDELEEMLHRDNLSVFISDVRCDVEVSTQALTEIQRRHQDIVSLESSIRELHDIFADTAMLLEIQGELINNIEKNVTSASEYVAASKEETDKAVTYKKNRFKIAVLPVLWKPLRRNSSVKANEAKI